MSDGRLPARRRWARWAIGIIVTLLLLATGWVVVRGAGAISEMQNVDRSASQLRSSLAKGDLIRVEKIAPRVPQHAALAHELTSDPIWRGFEIIPWVGPSFTAMREVAEITDSVAGDLVDAVLDVSGEIDLTTLGFSGAEIDLVPLAPIEETLTAAHKSLTTAEIQSQQIDANTVIPPLATAVRQMRDTLTEYATVVGALRGASVLASPMLGADGPRNYVVVMQNNAEVRSGGGSAESFTLLRADNGAISLRRQASAKDFPAPAQSLPLSDATTALFEDRPGRFVQSITSIPDFSEAGAMVALRWEEKFGDTIDGVIAIDAAVAAQLVEATGPISFGPFTADADTIMPILLSRLYAEVEPAQQDAIFAQAAKALFSAALVSGEPQMLIGAVNAAADEGRVRIWSAHPEEEEFLTKTALGGTLPDDGERGAHVGVLFNDLTGAKLNFYTEAAISTAVGVCSGEPTTQVHVTWKNNAPADAAESLPASVTGSEDEDRNPGDVRTLIAVYGPEGSTVKDSSQEAAQMSQLGTRTVAQYDVVLTPGESTTITVSFVGGGAGERLSNVLHTPMLTALQPTQGELVCE